VVSQVVDACLERRIRATAIDPELVEGVAVRVLGRRLGITAVALRRALDPLENVRTHAIRGGPAPEVVAGAVAEMRRETEAAGARLAAMVDAWRAAAGALDAEVAHVIGPTQSAREETRQ
jgi:argininosuccinate lyase